MVNHKHHYGDCYHCLTDPRLLTDKQTRGFLPINFLHLPCLQLVENCTFKRLREWYRVPIDVNNNSHHKIHSIFNACCNSVSQDSSSSLFLFLYVSSQAVCKPHKESKYPKYPNTANIQTSVVVNSLNRINSLVGRKSRWTSQQNTDLPSHGLI